MLTNKLKILKCSPHVFLNLFKHDIDQHIRVINPIPEDATMVRIFQDDTLGTLNIVIASESFPELHDGDQIPLIERPMFEIVYDKMVASST